VRLAVTVPPADAERALAEACAALGAGCREGVAADGSARLDFWVTEGRADPAGLAERLAAAGIAARVEASPQDDAWRDAMRAFHRPVVVAGRLLVRPPWAPARPPLLDVVVEPGMAFGTAQHATTRACLELLAALPDADGARSLLDAGCGSGVLAIAARRLGYDPVWALDSDALAVEATLENARANGVGLRVGRRTIGADRLPAADLVMANLTGGLLRRLAGCLPEPAPRALVASGMRPTEASAVEAGMARRGLVASRRIERDGWTTLLFQVLRPESDVAIRRAANHRGSGVIGRTHSSNYASSLLPWPAGFSRPESRRTPGTKH
jgi:ribosomal protein L11 methyltransferase